jgi:hypothetical protein
MKEKKEKIMKVSEELIAGVKAASEEVDGRLRLSCCSAFKVAHQYQVELKIIGRICNEQKIKLRNCQLGCF